LNENKIKIKIKKNKNRGDPLVRLRRGASASFIFFFKKNQNPGFDFFCSTKLGIFVFRIVFVSDQPTLADKGAEPAHLNEKQRKIKKKKRKRKKPGGRRWPTKGRSHSIFQCAPRWKATRFALARALVVLPARQRSCSRACIY
jgi:hypothetical protein